MAGMVSSTTTSTSRAALERVVRAMAGPDAAPRPDQLTAVEELVDHRRRVLVVQATGWGKSAVYWAATAALRDSGAGPTLVVSPLLALMRDQIAAAGRAGLRAATVNSTNVDDWDEVMGDVRAGRIDVLLVSPERLANPSFARQLPDLLAATGPRRGVSPPPPPLTTGGGPACPPPPVGNCAVAAGCPRAGAAGRGGGV